MKTAAIIAEFNPFHKGHKYLIDYAKHTLSADCVLVLMSGNFVQRGEPAVFDKFTRTRMALSAGADLVIELPCAFATASAREFANAAVAAIEKTGIADSLLFGTEQTEDLAYLKRVSAAVSSEGAAYRTALKEALKQGASYPKAKEAAIIAELSEENGSKANAAFLSCPNNILAVEYLRALSERRSRIEPCCLLRQGAGYNETTLDTSGFASATALRKLLCSSISFTEKYSALSRYVPSEVLPVYHPAFLSVSDLDVPLSLCLLRHNAIGTPLTDFLDVSPEIANRLKKDMLRPMSFSARVESLWTKQYTRSRISRALLHILLGITEAYADALKAADYVPYLRILGFSEAGKDALPLLKKNAAVPVVTKAAEDRELLRHEIYFSNFYYSLQASGASEPVRNEFERQIQIL